MMWRRPRATVIAPWLLLAVAMGAASCVRSAGGSDRVTLRFWGLGREGEVVAELIRDFERANPRIRVHVQQIPWTAAHEKLLTAHVGGASPDVAQLGNTWVPEFSAIHALAPLDTFYRSSRVVRRAAYFSGIWDTNVVDDTVFGIPWYVDTRVIFYRKDILARAGYDSIPQSWAGWLQALHAVKREMGADRYPIYLPTNEWAQPVIFGMQAGSPLLRDRGRHGAFSDSAFRTGFDFYLDLFREGLAPVEGQFEVANPFQEFERGYFAMWITGPWNLGEFKTRLPAAMQDRWATSPLPGPNGPESGVSLAGGASLVLFRSSRHPKAAWRLIEFLSRPEQQVRFYRLTGSLPARREAWTQAKLAEDPHARAFWVQLQRVRALPAVPEIESIVQRVTEHAESSIRGRVDAPAELKALDADVDRLLEKRRWVMARTAQ